MNDTNRPAAKSLRTFFPWLVVYVGGVVVTTYTVSQPSGLDRTRTTPPGFVCVSYTAPAIVCVLAWLILHILRWGRTRAAARIAARNADCDARHAAAERDRLAKVRAEQTRHAQTDQRRRDDVRARVELFFNVHAPELRARFTRDMLDDYLKRYVGNDQPPEVVEERAEAVLDNIRQHLDKAGSPIQKPSLDEILAAFESRKRKVQDSALDPQDKKTLLIQLDEEREATIRRAIRDGAL